MSDDKIQQKVDELDQPGKEEELDQALSEAFNQESSADDTSAAAEPAKTTGDDEDPIIPHEPSSEEAGEESGETGEEEGEEPSKQEAGEAEKDSTKQEGKSDRYKELLKDRNEAKEEAAAKDQENAELKQQLSQVNEKIETLANKLGQGEGSSSDQDEDADRPLTKSEVKQMLEDAKKSQKQAEDEQQAAEKSITEGISQLSEDPNFGELAKSRQEGLKEIMGKHKSVSAFGALAMKLGQEAIEQGKTGSGNIPKNTTKTGSRSKTKLRQGSKKVGDMSTDELEKHLEKEQGAGQLDI